MVGMGREPEDGIVRGQTWGIFEGMEDLRDLP